MSFPNYKYGTGLSNVGSYQVSGKPYTEKIVSPASASNGSTVPVKVQFPFVTKEIVISNAAATSHQLVRVAFSELGVRNEIGNYFLVGSMKDGNGATTLDVKATELYIMSDDNHTADVTVYASLTGIPNERITNISPSGSNWSGSAGIG